MDLQHLPCPLLGKVFEHLDACSRPAFTATCVALRLAALQAQGRGMVSRSLRQRRPGGGLEVAPPRSLAALTRLHELVVELDATAPDASADDVLRALAAMLACLPHCRRSSGAPRLHLCLRVVLPPGRWLPELEAFRLQHLLQDVGLLPNGVECVQLDAPWLSLDGGLAGVLCAARLAAERHLPEGLGAAYSRLRCLDLSLAGPAGLEAFAELVWSGAFPALRRLRLARQYPADPPLQPWDPVVATRRGAVLAAVAAARAAAYEAGMYASGSDCEELPPHPVDCPSFPGRLELARLRVLSARFASAAPHACCLCGLPPARCPCEDTCRQLGEELAPCYNGVRLCFLCRLPQLAALELANFCFAAEGALAALPPLPALQSLALTQEPWFRRLAPQANAGGRLAAALAEAFPSLQSLRLDRICDDAGISLLKGLTSLVIDQGCGEAGWQLGGYAGFSWETCRLRQLEELQLRGGWGSMGPHACWPGLLRPKGFGASGCARLRRLVFDVRGWSGLPDQAALEAFLAAVLDAFVNSNDSLECLESIHAVLEDGPYCASRNDGYLAAEGPLGAWGAVRDRYGQLWVALLAADQSPKVILMQQLVPPGGSGGGGRAGSASSYGASTGRAANGSAASGGGGGGSSSEERESSEEGSEGGWGSSSEWEG